MPDLPSCVSVWQKLLFDAILHRARRSFGPHLQLGMIRLSATHIRATFDRRRLIALFLTCYYFTWEQVDSVTNAQPLVD